MQYNPNLFIGSYFTEILTEILESTSLLENNLVRVLDNIKYQQVVTTMSGGFDSMPYSSLPVVNSATDRVSFSDTIVRPVKRMVYEEVDMEALRNTRFSEKMLAGASNTNNTEFDTLVVNYAGHKMKTSIVHDFLKDVIAKAKIAVPAVSQISATVDATNVYDILTQMYGLTSDIVLNSPDRHMLLDLGFKKFIQAANSSKAYRDVFLKEGEDFYVHDLKVVFQPLGKGCGLVTRPSDIILATDLTSDFGSLQVGKKFEYADILFIKGVYSLDSAIVAPEQKVLLTAI